MMDLFLGALCTAVVIAAVLLVNAVIVAAREIGQQEDDWQHFLKTGDDAGYKRRMKK